MLEIMKDLPVHVLGVRAIGKVDKDDYEQTMVPAIEQAAKVAGELNLLMLLETDISNFTYGAWMMDARESFRNFGRWNKIAIVTDQKVIAKITPLFGYLSPAVAKGFTVAEVELAKAWVSAPKEVTEK